MKPQIEFLETIIQEERVEIDELTFKLKQQEGLRKSLMRQGDKFPTQDSTKSCGPGFREGKRTLVCCSRTKFIETIL